MSIPLLSITIPNKELLTIDKWNIIRVEECSSTNSYIKDLRRKSEVYDRTAILTDFQTKGRGQGGNSWHSTKAENLLVSFYRKTDIAVDRNFMLTIIASISLFRLLKRHGIICTIKWPNDIYHNNCKIAGILIENTLMQNAIIDTVIGIGLNINETNFPDWVPNPCSMQQIKNKKLVVADILSELLEDFDLSFDLFSRDSEELFHTYNSLLFRRNKWHLFKENGTAFNARIHGVETDGRLILETDEGQLLHVLFGDIEYVI